MPKYFFVVLAALILAACGGGGNTSVEKQPALDAETIRNLTNSQPPIETNVTQLARAAGILSRTDSIIVSTLYSDSTSQDFPTFEMVATCSGLVCVFRHPETGTSFTITFEDLSFSGESKTKFALSKNDITLFAEEDDDGSDFSKEYGAWMQHSYFEVGSFRFISSSGDTVRSRFGAAFGDLTNNSPNASATWSGVMVGTPATGTNNGDLLQGDARLVYGFNTTGYAEIDATFTNIKNIEKNRSHSVTTVRFDNVPAFVNGTFRAGVRGNRIQGGFYGPSHEEIAGIFEQSDIVGGFGAKQ